MGLTKQRARCFVEKVSRKVFPMHNHLDDKWQLYQARLQVFNVVLIVSSIGFILGFVFVPEGLRNFFAAIPLGSLTLLLVLNYLFSVGMDIVVDETHLQAERRRYFAELEIRANAREEGLDEDEAVRDFLAEVERIKTELEENEEDRGNEHY